MNTIVVKVILDGKETEKVKALQEFMNSFAGEVTETTNEVEETQPDPQPKKEEKKKEQKKDKTIKIGDIRSLVSKKVNDHREDIKEKLSEYGAKNVTSLEEENYVDFYNFLNEL